jgi:SAM-dependent methyltransferase
MIGFDAALARISAVLVDSQGRHIALPIRRWHGPAGRADQAVVERCGGPTVDVGCGPGRMTAALAERGLISLGIDTSPIAIRLTRRRGAAALRRDVFAPLPGEGRWAHVLLMDGNIGIGGNPVKLLRRCHDLLRRGGTVLVELDPPGVDLWTGHAHLAGTPFRWARVGVTDLETVAAQAHLTVRAVFRRDHRWFAELERP